MSDQILDLIIIFGIAVVIAIQGYILVMLGRGLAQPEERQKIGSQLVFTGLMLVFTGFLTGVAAVILVVTNR
jgi:hypothetical protein